MKCLLIVLASVGVAAFDPSPASTTSTSLLTTVCYPADSYSAGHIAALAAMTGATNADGISWRQQVHLPAAGPSEIILVSDSTICARALTAFNRKARFDDGPATRLYLFQVGSMYVASNPNFPAGEWTQHFVFDSAFTYKASYLK